MNTRMNITLCVSAKSDSNKSLFTLKSPQSDGLILNVLYKTTKRPGRLISYCFHSNGNILAISDNEGHVYFIDFISAKYWSLPLHGSCTFIKFSDLNAEELLVAKTEAVIDIINVSSGVLIATLLGHTVAPTSVSFMDQYLCLTSSQNEAIVWDLRTNTRLQLLALQKESLLKFVHFIPVSGHILACFQDDIIQVWKKSTYENLKQFEPSNWSNYSVKSISFSRNGKVMVVAGHQPNLAVFLLDKWKLMKLVKLPEYILSVKSVEFVPQNFDGGSNQLLAVLSGKGIVYFYDIKNNVIISELKSECEINKFGISPTGDKAVCLMCSGEAKIYDLIQYIALPEDTVVQAPGKIINKKLSWRCYNKKVVGDVKDQIDEILEDEKLRTLLREYGQFPETCRLKIWTKFLSLPDNTRQYNSIINHVTVCAFDDLSSRFPLENKAMIGCLKRLLNNLVTWCPFFANVEYLPVFVFPFVKIFHANPIATFEVVCSVILNWCQHWFEYYPLVPVNVLAIIDNILMEHDPDLLQFYAVNNITANIFAWPLLETAFSEVLTTSQWLQFWDHVLSNEPAFLICAVAAFNVCQRRQIAIKKNEDEFELFFHTQNALNMKQFISKSYHILNVTSEKLHPRQYLDHFKSIECGSYPEFCDYPKTLIEFENKEIGPMEEELREIQSRQELLASQKRNEHKDVMELEIQKEQERRLFAMKNAVMEKLVRYQDAIKSQQDKLKNMRRELIEEEKGIINNSRRKLKEFSSKKEGDLIVNLSRELDLSTTANEIQLIKAEDDILCQRLELLRGRKVNLSRDNKVDGGDTVSDWQMRETYVKPQPFDSRKLRIVSRIAEMEKLIDEIRLETRKEAALRQLASASGSSIENGQASELRQETKKLEKEVLTLLKVLYQKSSTIQGSSETIKSRSSAATLTKNVRFSTATGTGTTSSLDFT